MATLELNVNPRGAVDGSARAERALEGVGQEAVRAEKSLDRMGSGGARATTRLARATGTLGRSMQGARGQIQNTAFQVGDFATKVGAGTSASVALGQQLPQLIGGFGALGAVLGAVLSVGIPLAAKFLDLGGKAADLDEQISDLRDAVNDYRDAIKLAGLDTSEAAAMFGSAAGEIAAVNDVLSELARVEAVEALTESMERLGQSLDVGLLDSLAGFADTAEGTIRKIAFEFDVSTEAATRLKEGFDALESAQGVNAQINAGAQLHSILLEVFGTVADIPPELREVVKATGEATQEAGRLNAAIEEAEGTAIDLSNVDMAKGFGPAIEAAAALADQLGISLDLALAIGGETDRIQRRQQEVLTPLGAHPVLPVELTGGPRQSTIVNPAPRPRRSGGGSRRRSGGGGRASGVDEEAQAVERLREAYKGLTGSLDEVVRAQHEYEDSQKLLNEALKAGVINQEQFDATMKQVKDRFDEARFAADGARDNFSDFFTSIITGAKSAKEALAGLIAEFASKRLNAAFDSLFNNIAGAGGGGFLSFLFSAKGNAFSGGNVIPFARGGVVDGPSFFPLSGGKTGVMGEAGPEAIMPLKRGPGGRLGVEGGGQQQKPSPIGIFFDKHIFNDWARGAEGEAIMVDMMTRNGFARA